MKTGGKQGLKEGNQLYRKNISDVFTPRSAFVNKDMYVHREKLESELSRKIRGTQNIVVYGESGCGKSWLYKHVLKEKSIKYEVINLALVESYDGILDYMSEEADAAVTMKTGYDEKKYAEGNVVVAKGGAEHTGNYKINSKTTLFKYLDRFFENTPGFICFENMEVIFGNAKLMKELGNLITLLDDENFAKYKTRFIIVGVPSGILHYFSKTKNLTTVSNRLIELSEVTPLRKEQVDIFVNNGFKKFLKVKFKTDADFEMLCEHIFFITKGIPQYMHEYSEILSYIIEEFNWKFDTEMLDKADKQWLEDSLYKNYEVIQQLMNSENTTVGRRNQVLYCIGQMHCKSFTTNELENVIRSEFPKSCENKILNLTIPLGDITENLNTFIMHHAKSYYISDMRYVLCIRAMLKKVGEKIVRIDLNDL